MITVTQEIKQAVRKAAKSKLAFFDNNQSRLATFLGINKAQVNRAFIKDEDGQIISDANWISAARKLDVEIGDNKELDPANTDVFEYINSALKLCKENSICSILCDNAGIGKSYAAKYFANKTENTIYVDCSQCKQKTRLIRGIARAFGLNHLGRYQDVYDDLAFYIRTVDRPLIILDEAGDLDREAVMELKAIWNATQYCGGWYMMGADGLKRKIEDNIISEKVGYAETLSRFADKFNKITPAGEEAYDQYMEKMVHEIAIANGVQSGLHELFLKLKYGNDENRKRNNQPIKYTLRRLRTEIIKIKLSN